MADINDIFNMNIEQDLEALKKEDNLPLKASSNKQTLSEDQERALSSMNDWLYKYPNSRDDNNFYRLTGSAGTGKTTLLSTFLKDIKAPFRNSQIAVCAPTHKAKKVVREKTGWRNSETLQSLLGLRADTSIEDYDPNNPQFNPIGDRKIRDYKLVIIDESSMINSALYISVIDAAKSAGCKVLFVGDTKQLNPVKEYNISPSLIAPINGYNLTQIVRQGKTNPLILLLDALRYDIENNTSTYSDILKENPVQVNDLNEGYQIVNPQDFALNLSTTYSCDSFKEDKNYCRYISWTNVSITATNQWMRNKALKLENKTLELEEIMLSYKTIMDGDDIVLTNSDDYIVEKISDSSIGSYGYNLRTVFAHLRGIDTGSVSKVHILIKEEDNYKNYVEIYKQQLDKAVSYNNRKSWEKFHEFKNEILVLDNITTGRKDKWGKDEYVKKDLDYGYGITIHKSQGSTYNTVFVNGKDINKNPNDIERKRLWYVALSRASRMVYINL